MAGSSLVLAGPIPPATPGFPFRHFYAGELGDNMPFAIIVTHDVNGMHGCLKLGHARAHDCELTFLVLHRRAKNLQINHGLLGEALELMVLVLNGLNLQRPNPTLKLTRDEISGASLMYLSTALESQRAINMTIGTCTPLRTMWRLPMIRQI